MFVAPAVTKTVRSGGSDARSIDRYRHRNAATCMPWHLGLDAGFPVTIQIDALHRRPEEDTSH